MASLCINEHVLANTDRNNTNHLVFNQMDENFEVFIRKYTQRKKYNSLQMIEACIFLFHFGLNDAAYRTRRGKKTKGKNKVNPLLASIDEDRIIRYLCILFTGKYILMLFLV